MSSYRVLFRVSHELRRLLLDEMISDDEIEINDPTQIVFVNPTAAAKNDDSRLSLWLYRVVENGYTKNTPMQRGNASTISTFPPLSLDLYYLVTPIVRPDGNQDRTLLLLGKTMQVFYDRSMPLLNEDGFDVHETLRISLMSLTLEEQTRIWEALQAPYQLSVCYQVRIARIDSERTLTRQPVEHRASDFANGTTQ